MLNNYVHSTQANTFITYFNFITNINNFIIIFSYNIVKYQLDFKSKAIIFNFE